MPDLSQFNNHTLLQEYALTIQAKGRIVDGAEPMAILEYTVDADEWDAMKEATLRVCQGAG